MLVGPSMAPITAIEAACEATLSWSLAMARERQETALDRFRAEGIEIGENAPGKRVRRDVAVTQTAPEAQTPGDAQSPNPLDLELGEGLPECFLLAGIVNELLVAVATVVVREILLLVDQLSLESLSGPEVGCVHQYSVHPRALRGHEQLDAVFAAIRHTHTVVLEEVDPQAISGAVVGTEVQQG